MTMWNWSDTDCKNEWAIFTHLISLTGSLAERAIFRPWIHNDKISKYPYIGDLTSLLRHYDVIFQTKTLEILHNDFS